MPKTEILKLADRVEALDGPDREVDRLIMSAMGWIGATPAFTASIDAALTLVPEGVGLTITRYWIVTSDGPVWSAEIVTGGLAGNPRKVFDCYDTASPALAIVAASLRAIAGGGDEADV